MADEVVQPETTTPAPEPAQVPLPSEQVQQPAQTQQEFNLLSYVNEKIPGVKDRYQNEQSLTDELIQAAMQAQQYAPYAQIGQRFAPHVQEFEAWQAERAAKQKAEQQQAQQKWWQAPEYDPRWEKQVMIDPQTGRLAPMPGAPLDLPSRLEAYREWQRQKLNDITRDPIGTLHDGLAPMIEQIAQRIADERVSAMQQQSYSQNYIQQNLGWLAQKDVQGRPVTLPTGGYALTPAGERFRHHVSSLHAAGVTDPRMQQEMAEKMLAGEIAMMQTQQPAQQAAPQPVKLAFQTPTTQGNYGETGAGAPTKSLKEMLKEDLSRAGLYQQPV